MPSRQEKFRERERHILDSAWDLVAAEGFLALKISELAKMAGVSVGTLYVHFESKEDLIIAMALDSWRARIRVLAQALNGVGTPVEQLLGFSILGYRYDQLHPARFEAEQLAGVPSIWQRASLRRHQEIPESCESFLSRLTPLILEAVDSGELETRGDPEQQIDAIQHGLWAVSMGNAYITYVITPDKVGDKAQTHDLERNVRQHIIALFRGYGWRPKDAQAVHAQVRDRLADLPMCGGLKPAAEPDDAPR